jgi:hypothetical protein
VSPRHHRRASSAPRRHVIRRNRGRRRGIAIGRPAASYLGPRLMRRSVRLRRQACRPD